MKIFLLIFLSLYVSRLFSQEKNDTINRTKTFILDISWHIDTVDADTSFFHIHQYKETSKYLGLSNLDGISPFYSFIVFDNCLPFWLENLNVYISSLNNRYFHTFVPFTQVRLISNTNRTYNEEIVKALHTQNINKHWNIMFEALSNKNISRLPHQDNRFHYLFSSTNYISTRHYLIANFLYSKFKIKENGGVLTPEFLKDSLFPYENAFVYLNNASNLYVIKKFNFNYWFNIFSDSSLNVLKPWLIAKVNTLSSKKIYKDNMLDTSYYRNIYYDTTKTYDSLFYRTIVYSAGFSFASLPYKGKGFYILGNYKQRTSYSYMLPLKEDGIFVTLAYFNQVAKNRLFLKVNYGLNGYLTKITSFDFEHFYKFTMFNTKLLWHNYILYSHDLTDVFIDQFNSNHSKWKNERYYKNSAQIESSINKGYDNLKLFAKIIEKYFYFDKLLTPQVISNLNLFGIEISKLVRFKNVYSYNKILLQHANKLDYIPNFAAYHSLYYENKVFKKVLTIQVGADVWYHSYYTPVGYFPALNVYYFTDGAKVGYYPLINLFFNTSLKRAKFFIMLQHANYAITHGNFFLIKSYPLPSRMLKFGIIWNFYD